ncbi:MAG: U32 family peptidase [Candidatus Gastranaerophilales bacterium]|nr:U32 family peptidase [Candidatus Gastranaerophilales bacterium]
MKEVELLAPAKNLEIAIAAINSGADAIYIGAEEFGARKNAPNSLIDIEKLVKYAHKFYVRIHVVINTILNDSELEKAVELVKKLYDIGVDAIIVQDMGLIKAAIDGKLPPIQIHASTQCNNRTIEKAKFFDNLGLSRVILARELSQDLIAEICKNTDCEIETFIHGALCVSYSGQCYFSYANGGRSANRGECAQPCRKKYSLIDEKGCILLKDKYLLSLKDFNASENIEKLISCGVKSFKIEGRLKDINYVKNVVAYYNELINKYAKRTSSGKVLLDFEPNPDKTFNRGYTNYFLTERSQCFNFLSPKSRGEKIGKVKRIFHNYFEIDADLSPQDGLCFIKDGEMSGFLINKVEGNKIYPNKMDGIKTGTLLYRNYDSKFERQLEISKTVRKIAVKFIFSDNILTAIDEDCNTVKIEMPIGEIPKNIDKMRENIISQLKKTGESDYYTTSVELDNAKITFIPVSKINEIRREILSLLNEERLRNYKRLEQKPIGYAPFPEREMGYRANVFNNDAKFFYENCNCKITEPALETFDKVPSGIELMRTKHCLKFAAGLCGQSCKKLYLRDSKDKKYPLRFDCKNCEMVILNP